MIFFFFCLGDFSGRCAPRLLPPPPPLHTGGAEAIRLALIFYIGLQVCAVVPCVYLMVGVDHDILSSADDSNDWANSAQDALAIATWTVSTVTALLPIVALLAMGFTIRALDYEFTVGWRPLIPP